MNVVFLFSFYEAYVVMEDWKDILVLSIGDETPFQNHLKIPDQQFIGSWYMALLVIVIIVISGFGVNM